MRRAMSRGGGPTRSLRKQESEIRKKQKDTEGDDN